MTLPGFERFAAVRIISTVRYSPDGKQIAYIANTTGYANLWLMPAGGGFPRQLTSFTQRRVTDLRWSPDGRTIAFTADHHGDEMHQVFVIDAEGGWPRQLTDAPEVQYALGSWTPDSRRILVSGNDREPHEIDPQLLDVRSGEVERLMTGAVNYGISVSPNGRHALVVEFLSNTHLKVHLVDIASHESRLILGEEGEAVYDPQDWALDSSGFYLLSNAGRQFTGLAFYSLESGRLGYSHAPDRDVEDFELARDGRTTLAAVNVGGASQLQSYDMERGAELPLPELPPGQVTSMTLHPNERKAVIVLHRAVEAGNLVEVDFDRNSLSPLEQSMLGGLRSEDLIEPEIISYPSFDREIPSWLYLPRGEGPFPTVLSIHGGPEAQERPAYGYSGLYQYLLSRNIAIMAPNVRGSSGYGIDYQKLIHRDWGGGELEDIRHAALYLRSQEWADAERVAVFGGSFGGFATLSALSRLPEYWAAGVDVVGPSNLVTFVGSVPPHWRSSMKNWVGDAEEDFDMLMERSPISYVDSIRAPLLVIQGANDPRVVKAESDQMVERLRSLGREVEYYVDEESGHGPASRAAALQWWEMTARFLEERLARPNG